MSRANLSPMHLSKDARASVSYWDRVACEKRFPHPLHLEWLKRYTGLRARIVDFGCGYGRTLGDFCMPDTKTPSALISHSGC